MHNFFIAHGYKMKKTRRAGTHWSVQAGYKVVKVLNKATPLHCRYTRLCVGNSLKQHLLRAHLQLRAALQARGEEKKCEPVKIPQTIYIFPPCFPPIQLNYWYFSVIAA